MHVDQLGFHILSTPTLPKEGWGRQNVGTVLSAVMCVRAATLIVAAPPCRSRLDWYSSPGQRGQVDTCRTDGFRIGVPSTNARPLPRVPPWHAGTQLHTKRGFLFGRGWGRQGTDTELFNIWTGVACYARGTGHLRSILAKLVSTVCLSQHVCLPLLVWLARHMAYT